MNVTSLQSLIINLRDQKIVTNGHRYNADTNALYNFYNDLRNDRGSLDRVDITIDGVRCLKKRKPREDSDKKRSYFTIRHGKAIRLLASEDTLNNTENPFTDQIVEEIVNTIRARLDQRTTIRIVESDEIPFWYNSNNYSQHEAGHHLINSCMMLPNYTPYLTDFYTTVGNVAKLMICVDSGDKLAGRMLLWHNAATGITNYDRCYAADHARIAMNNEATRLGYQPIRNSTSISIPVEHPEHIFRRAPYMDSMRYFNIDTKCITNSHPPENSNSLQMSSTSCEVYFQYQNGNSGYWTNMTEDERARLWGVIPTPGNPTINPRRSAAAKRTIANRERNEQGQLRSNAEIAQERLANAQARQIPAVQIFTEEYEQAAANNW